MTLRNIIANGSRKGKEATITAAQLLLGLLLLVSPPGLPLHRSSAYAFSPSSSTTTTARTSLAARLQRDVVVVGDDGATDRAVRVGGASEGGRRGTSSRRDVLAGTLTTATAWGLSPFRRAANRPLRRPPRNRRSSRTSSSSRDDDDRIVEMAIDDDDIVVFVSFVVRGVRGRDRRGPRRGARREGGSSSRVVDDPMEASAERRKMGFPLLSFRLALYIYVYIYIYIYIFRPPPSPPPPPHGHSLSRHRSIGGGGIIYFPAVVLTIHISVSHIIIIHKKRNEPTEQTGGRARRDTAIRCDNWNSNPPSWRR